MKKLLILLAVVVLVNGCAVARVWKNTDSNVPTTQKEVDVALSKCEVQEDVAGAHSRAKTWSGVCLGTCLIPFVGLAMCITSGSQWSTYEATLTKCMQGQGYYLTKTRSNKPRWDEGSDFDTSEESRGKQKE